MFKVKNTQKGFSLVELMVYVSILILIIIALFSTLMSTTKSYKTIKATRLVHSSALSLFDRLSYEIRSSYAVDLNGSTLGNDNGVLSLDKNIDEVMSNILFDLSEGRALVAEDSILEGYLTNENVSVNKMRFDVYTNNGSVIISIEVQLETTVGDYVYTKDFEASYVARGAY